MPRSSPGTLDQLLALALGTIAENVSAGRYKRLFVLRRHIQKALKVEYRPTGEPVSGHYEWHDTYRPLWNMPLDQVVADVEAAQSYPSIVALLGPNLPPGWSSPHHLLTDLVAFVLENYPQEHATLRRLADHNPPPVSRFSHRVGLVGLSLPTRSIDFTHRDASFRLRRPRLSDHTQVLGDYPSIGPPANQAWAILEAGSTVVTGEQTTEQIHEVVRTLRLFLASSISVAYIKHLRLEPFSRREIWETASWSPQHLITPFTRRFGPEHRRALAGFVGLVEAWGRVQEDSWDRAEEAYVSALVEAPKAEAQIALAITGLEAVLGESQGELTYRLATRLAGVAAHADVDPIGLYLAVKKGYDLRSRYVHGDRLPLKLPVPRDVLAHILVESLRFVVILARTLACPKKQLVENIDYSLFDAASRLELHASLAEPVGLACLHFPAELSRFGPSR